MEVTDLQRILVVGCSRSGTTLLQSLLASHSGVHTFPETGVFLKTFGMRGKVLPWARVGLTMGKERKALARLLPTQRGAPGNLPPLPPRRFFLRRSLSDIVDFFDALAMAHGKRAWLEKTPRHVFHSERIRRAVPGVVCVHILRRGEDVVASIVDRARRYPHRFPRQIKPAYGIRQWNRSLRCTAEALENPGHVAVFYRDLATETEETLRALSPMLGLPFEPGMLSPAHRSRFSGEDEGWKSKVEGPVQVSSSKFERVFDEESRRDIRGRLDTETFLGLRRRADKRPGGVLTARKT